MVTVFTIISILVSLYYLFQLMGLTRGFRDNSETARRLREEALQYLENQTRRGVDWYNVNRARDLMREHDERISQSIIENQIKTKEEQTKPKEENKKQEEEKDFIL